MSSKKIDAAKYLRAILPRNHETLSRPVLYKELRKRNVPAQAAARIAGYSVDRSKALKVKEDSLTLLLDMAGVTPQRLAEKISDGLEATKSTVTRDGDVVETPDHTAQHKYLVTALELKGEIGVKANQNAVNNGVVININRPDGSKHVLNKGKVVDVEGGESDEDDVDVSRGTCGVATGSVREGLDSYGAR